MIDSPQPEREAGDRAQVADLREHARTGRRE